MFSLKAHYYLAYHIETLFWLKSPDIMEFSSWKRFVVNCIICCAKEARASIVLNIEWVQFGLQNSEKNTAEV